MIARGIGDLDVEVRVIVGVAMREPTLPPWTVPTEKRFEDPSQEHLVPGSMFTETRSGQ